jgi:hypothetical protein
VRFAVQLKKVAIAEALTEKATIHRSGRFKLGTFCKDLCGDDLPKGGLPALCLHVGEALFIAGTNTSDALHWYPPDKIVSMGLFFSITEGKGDASRKTKRSTAFAVLLICLVA